MIYLLPIIVVLISFIFVKIIPPFKQKTIKLLLAFSGAFLLSMTVFELLPMVYMETNGGTREIGVFILVGILLQIILEFFSKGAEHGHHHGQDGTSTKMSFSPWLLFFSISLHAFLEGFPLASNDNMIYGILLHKFPVVMVLTVFLINTGLEKSKIFLFILLFSLMTPLGSYLAANGDFFIRYHCQITAAVIGVLLHVSTIILFENSENHDFNFNKLLTIFIGIFTAYIV